MAIVDPTDYSSILGGNSNFPNMWELTNAQAAQAQAEIAQVMQATQAQQLTYQGTKSQSALDLAGRARELFLKRMGSIRAELKLAPGDFLQCHVYNDTVHVFYCFSGKPGVVQEGIDLFPSDQLITQFRLILS